MLWYKHLLKLNHIVFAHHDAILIQMTISFNIPIFNDLYARFLRDFLNM